jgi:hypothetical protein
MQHPLFQAGVVVASSSAAAAEAASAAASLDLVLVLLQQQDQQQQHAVHLLYNSGLFTDEGAELMAQHFQVGETCKAARLVAAVDPQVTDLLYREWYGGAGAETTLMCLLCAF